MYVYVVAQRRKSHHIAMFLWPEAMQHNASDPSSHLTVIDALP
jgi:hypothetical protein